MGHIIKILVADRNRHVREFIRRELTQEGYSVAGAGDSYEILAHLAAEPRADVVIIDLDIPYLAETDLLAKLGREHPHLPVIIYAYPSDDVSHVQADNIAAFLEKKEDPDSLKQVLAEVTAKYFPSNTVTL